MLKNTSGKEIKIKENIISGGIVGAPGVVVNYGSYIVKDRLLIITASITATNIIAIYQPIMYLDITEDLAGNCYMRSTDNTNCYINKAGMVAIYKSGGFQVGTTLTWEGVYALAA